MATYLTPARQKLREEARDFAINVVLPVANRVDKTKADIPEDLLEAIAEKGYFGITVPEKYGGLGLGVVEYCIISEELSRAWMSVASIIARGNGKGIHAPDEATRTELLKKSARGEWVGAVALSEPEAGSDLANITCSAAKTKTGWRLSGEKRWCGNALAADWIQILARTEDDPSGRWKGLEYFFVPKKRGAFPQGITGDPINTIGYHGITSWHLYLNDLEVPGTALVIRDDGRPGEAFKSAVVMLNEARVHTAARAVGLAQGAYEDALGYAQQRMQFGRPLADFQAIRFKLAHMAAQIEAARQLYLYAATLIDDGHMGDAEAAMSKYFASEMAERVTSEGLQIFGGNGYTTDYAAERYWRDARLTKIFEGTSEMQLHLIAKRILDEDAVVEGAGGAAENWTAGGG